MKKLMAFLLTLVLAFAVFGCASKEKEVLPTGIKLTLGSEVEVDGELTGKVTFTPSDVTNKNVTWESSDPEVASVKNGKVTGLKPGTATITVTSQADSKIVDRVTVTVKAAAVVELVGLSFTKSAASVAPDKSIKLTLVFDPKDASDQTVEWSSSDPAIATVVNGIVTGVAEGTCTIKATSKANPELFAECTLTVDPNAEVIYAEFVEILDTVASIFVNETYQFSLGWNHNDTEKRPSDRNCKWVSSDESIATIDSRGVVTAIAPGEVKFTVYALGIDPSTGIDPESDANPVQASITLKIEATVAPTKFEASVSSTDLKPGTGTKIVISVEPENGDKRATFASDNESIATVDEWGNVSTTKESNGKVNITVTSVADPTKSVVITLNVADQEQIDVPESVVIKGEQQTYVGDAYSIALMAVVLPSTAPQDVIWTSNNPAVATVDEKGLVTGVAIGTARIRATCKDYPDVKSSFFNIQIVERVVYEDPDLKGYEIIIMNAASALGDIDPFLDTYTQSDKSYKQEAWREVEEDCNCKIKVVAYPDDAPWGEPRISWLIKNANAGTSQCDLGTVSTNWMYRFAEENGNAAVDVSDYYMKYGDSQMTTILKECGSYRNKIYVASTGTSPVAQNVDFGLYYNLGLLEKLNLPNPAKMFNDGQWTYTNFMKWVRDAQALLGKGEGKYALAGHPYYWWFGLTNAAGVKVADTTAVKVNISTTQSKAAAEMYATLFQEECIDKVGSWCESNSDNNAWFSGNALMTTGYFWFVKGPNRWYEDLWGEDTRFGYVPFPYPDDMPKEQTRISNSGLSAYLYVKGREYPQGVTVGDVYFAVNKMYLETIKKQKADPLFNADAILETAITKRIDDIESVEAMKFFDSTRLFFDPAHALYTSTAATPLKTPCVNVMMNGEDYDEQFDAVFSQYDTDFKKIFG